MKIPDKLKRQIIVGGLASLLVAGFAYALVSQSRANSPVKGGAGGGDGAHPEIGGGGTGGCVPYTDTACGTNCIDCTATPPNETGICSNGVCVYGCDAGYHMCGGTCVSLSASSCGNSCTDCSAGRPGNSTASCSVTSGTGSGGVCQYACNGGYHNCGGTTVSCVALSTSSCGDSCTSCSTQAPGNSTATACSIVTGNGSGGVCDCTCNAGYWPGAQSSCSALTCKSQSFSTIY